MAEKSVNDITKELLEEVQKRIASSYKKYGDQFLIADIKGEFDEEIFDIVGWPLLLAIRLKMISEGIVNETNEKYLNKFVKRAKTDYLEKLFLMIQTELGERGHFDHI